MRHNLIAHDPGKYPAPKPSLTYYMNEDGAGVLQDDASTTFILTPHDLLSRFLISKYRSHALLIHDADPTFKALLPELQMCITCGFRVEMVADGRGRIISATLHKGRDTWHIRNTSALMPLKWDEMGEMVGERLGDTLEAHTNLLSTTYSLYQRTVLQAFGTQLYVTAGATAVRAWRSTMPPGQVHWHHAKRVNELAREAYFGGLLYNRSTKEQHDLTHLDRNGAYASIMANGVPTMGGIGEPGEYAGRPALYNCSLRGGGGCLIPFIPYRRDSSPFASLVKLGEQANVVMATPMIDAARGEGYIVEVGEGYSFEQVSPIFDTFISRCQELEHRYRGDGSRKVIKLLRNSLHGKFAQHNSYRTYYLTTEPDIMWTPVIAFETGEEIEGLYYSVEEAERAHTFPVWGAWITASARADLMRVASAIGQRYIAYMDTDSIICDGTAPWQAAVTLGADYGDWKVVRRYSTFLALAPKMYRGVDQDTGEIIEVTAGSPPGVLSEEAWAQLAQNMKVSRVIPRKSAALRSMQHAASLV